MGTIDLIVMSSLLGVDAYLPHKSGMFFLDILVTFGNILLVDHHLCFIEANLDALPSFSHLLVILFGCKTISAWLGIVFHELNSIQKGIDTVGLEQFDNALRSKVFGLLLCPETWTLAKEILDHLVRLLAFISYYRWLLRPNHLIYNLATGNLGVSHFIWIWQLDLHSLSSRDVTRMVFRGQKDCCMAFPRIT